MFWRQVPQFTVDLGSRSVKAVSAKYLGKNRFQVSRQIMVDAPDEELFKSDPKADMEIPAGYHRVFGEVVRSAGLGAKYVVLLYPDFAFNVKVLPISSKVNDQEKNAAIEQELKTWVAADAERAEWITQLKEPGKLHNDLLVLISMLKRRSVMELGTVFQKLGAYPVVIDLGLLSAINVFSDYLDDPANKDKNIGVLNFGHHASSIAIFKDGTMAAFHSRGLSTEGHSELLMGGKAFTKRIMEHFKLPEYDAEAYKREEVFFLPEFVPEQDKITNYQVIKPVFGELVKGLFAITENYMAFFREFKVDEIILTGGGANFSNIDVVLGGHLNIFIKKGSQVVSMVDPAGNELPEDVKNLITPAVGGCYRES
jgi:Tfp pilus assembly PilM family ATPase